MVKRSSAMSIAKKALKIASQNKESKEIKFYDTADSGNVGSTWAHHTDYLSIPQGSTDVTRNGNMIFVKNIKVRQMVNLAATTPIQGLVRVVWYIWKDDSAPGGANDLFDNEESALAPYSPLFRGKYQVLSDKTYNMSTAKNDVVYNQHKFKINKTLGYASAATTEGQQWRLICAYIYSSYTGSTAPVLTLKCNVEYNDS